MSTNDVYQNFFRGKGAIKVFPTRKNASPFAIAKRVCRRVYPFLLASAMVLTGCGQKEGKKSQNNDNENKTEILVNTRNAVIVDTINYSEIYEQVIEKYNLNKLKQKEPLSQEFIDYLMELKDVPDLVDINYNHLPENEDNFWNIVKNGVKISTKDVQKSPTLSNEQKSTYKIMAYKMLSQISKYKGTVNSVDINDYNNLKSFLYFEKVVEYKDNYRKVHSKADGLIDARNEVLGRYYEDYEALRDTVYKNFDVLNFAEAFYKDKNKDKILCFNDSVICNKASYEILDRWMKEQDIKDDGLYYLTSVEDDDYCNGVSIINKRGKDLGVVLGVDSWGELGDGYYAPVGEIIIHEMMHVMQTKPASKEKPEDNAKVQNFDMNKLLLGDKEHYINELGPSLMSLVIDDYLYKKVNNIPQDNVVDYGSFQVNDKSIDIGSLALWFREKIDKYKTDERFSVDNMLIRPEVFKELKAISNGNIPKRFNYTYNNSNILSR